MLVHSHRDWSDWRIPEGGMVAQHGKEEMYLGDSGLQQLERTDDGVVLRFVDGSEASISYEDLRLHCPCAKCGPRWKEPNGRLELVDEIARMPRERPKAEAVGRYGVRFTWTAGCSSGIYAVEHMRSIADGTAI